MTTIYWCFFIIFVVLLLAWAKWEEGSWRD